MLHGRILSAADREVLMAKRKLKVLYVSSEAHPFAKSGGLGDVAGSLPVALKNENVDCRIAIPKYSKISNDLLLDAKFIASVPVKMGWRNTGASVFEVKHEVTAYLIENHSYYSRDGLYGYFDDGERFAFFCKAVLDMLPLIGWQPDIIHCNDWQTGPVCTLLQDVYKSDDFYKKMKCIYTIHNIQYQGVFPKETLAMLDLHDGYYCMDGLEFNGMISYMKAGLISANAVTTVSKTYAFEIQTPSFGYGLDGVLRKRARDLCGIVNGIDYSIYNPETDKKIVQNYNDYEGKQANKTALQKELGLDVSDSPIIAMITRLVDQKGMDLISICKDEMVQKGAQLVFLGTGDGRYEYMLKDLEQRYPGRVSSNIRFDATLANHIYAGSDFFLMPSVFEPCGLGQLMAMRYGSIPIVRNTGGLSDTVVHYNAPLGEGTGFLFNDFVADAMMWAVNEALKIYHADREAMQTLVTNAMSCDFSWGKSAGEYAKLYQNVHNLKV